MNSSNKENIKKNDLKETKTIVLKKFIFSGATMSLVTTVLIGALYLEKVVLTGLTKVIGILAAIPLMIITIPAIVLTGTPIFNAFETFQNSIVIILVTFLFYGFVWTLLYLLRSKTIDSKSRNFLVLFLLITLTSFSGFCLIIFFISAFAFSQS